VELDQPQSSAGEGDSPKAPESGLYEAATNPAVLRMPGMGSRDPEDPLYVADGDNRIETSYVSAGVDGVRLSWQGDYIEQPGDRNSDWMSDLREEERERAEQERRQQQERERREREQKEKEQQDVLLQQQEEAARACVILSLLR